MTHLLSRTLADAKEIAWEVAPEGGAILSIGLFVAGIVAIRLSAWLVQSPRNHERNT